jgi:hypothetical protein
LSSAGGKALASAKDILQRCCASGISGQLKRGCRRRVAIARSNAKLCATMHQLGSLAAAMNSCGIAWPGVQIFTAKSSTA